MTLHGDPASYGKHNWIWHRKRTRAWRGAPDVAGRAWNRVFWPACDWRQVVGWEFRSLPCPHWTTGDCASMPLPFFSDANTFGTAKSTNRNDGD